jgi:2-isopropylmalate synthase
MRPEDVGFSKSNLVLGKHSGRHAFRMRVRELGFDLDEFETNRAFQEFKKLADRKKDMYDGDIEAIVLNVDGACGGPWTLQSLLVTSGTGRKASAAITLIDGCGQSVEKTASADGPAEAVFRALELATEIDPVLKSFDLHSATSGEDAQAEATVVVDYDSQTFRGHGTSTDIVEAGGRAYLEVINRILRRRERGNLEASTIGDINQASI